MKIGGGILKREINKEDEEHFTFYNSFVLTDDLAFQRKYFKKTPKGAPRIYEPEARDDDDGSDIPIQTRTKEQKITLLKIAILIASSATQDEITHAIIDSGASCCVTPYINDFIKHPKAIQNTTLKWNNTTKNQTK